MRFGRLFEQALTPFQLLVSPFASIKSIWKNRFFNWVDRRIANGNTHTLKQKNLYILPSRRGFFYLFLVLLLWIIGTNYQNNLVLATAFFMASIFVIAILHTYANMAGLKLSYKGANPVFAGEHAEFVFIIESQRREYADALELRWQDEDLSCKGVYVTQDETCQVRVPILTHFRGVFKPGRLLVKSYYPLGLFRCWTWLNWDANVLVYPQPIQTPIREALVVDESSDSSELVRGGDDFYGFSEYSAGKPLKHIAWKSFAKGEGLYVKEYATSMSTEKWLDIDTVVAEDLEAKLSGLCYQCLQYHRENVDYGLRLPGRSLALSKGIQHKSMVLAALAKYQWRSDSEMSSEKQTGDAADA